MNSDSVKKILDSDQIRSRNFRIRSGFGPEISGFGLDSVPKILDSDSVDSDSVPKILDSDSADSDSVRFSGFGFANLGFGFGGFGFGQKFRIRIRVRIRCSRIRIRSGFAHPYLVPSAGTGTWYQSAHSPTCYNRYWYRYSAPDLVYVLGLHTNTGTQILNRYWYEAFKSVLVSAMKPVPVLALPIPSISIRIAHLNRMASTCSPINY